MRYIVMEHIEQTPAKKHTAKESGITVLAQFTPSSRGGGELAPGTNQVTTNFGFTKTLLQKLLDAGPVRRLSKP